MATTTELVQAAYDSVARGRIDLAIADLQRHVRFHPDDVELHHHLALIQLQNGQFDEALFQLDKAIQLAPKRADLRNNRATALNYKGKAEEAAEAYREALELDARSFPAQLGLSSALIGTLEFDKAMEAARAAAELAPTQPEPAVNLALAQARSGSIAEALATLRTALERLPDHPLLLSNLVLVLPQTPEATPADVLEAHTRLARVWTSFAGVPVPLFSDMKPERRLRVGYLSPEFKESAVPAFIRPLLEAHDRQRFEVVGYSVTHAPDKTTQALKPMFDRFVEAARLNDVQLDQQIRADKIDILVDLSGFTTGGRVGVMTRRSAPVQVSFPTYPCSTGFKSIGFRVVDGIADPPEADAQASEKLVRLEGCCLCYQAPADAPAVSARAGGAVTFGCLAESTQINGPVLDAFASILKALPGSRLVLKSQYFGSSLTRERYTAMLGERGIAADRVEIAGQVLARERLAGYAGIDIALDPFPMGSPGLACEALHMGVPVVTLRGEAHAGRMVASVLTAAGLGELVAGSADEYTKLAAGLAKDTGRLASLRSGLRGKLAASPLCDAAGYTARLEAAYREMWKAACENVYYT